MPELNDLDYLRMLKDRGIEVRAAEGRLRINAPAGAVTQAMQQELLSRKSRLLEMLDPATPPQLIHHADTRKAPLTFAQEGIWLVERFYPGTAAYSIPEAFVFDFPVDIEILRRALRKLVRRHEILRASVVETDAKAFLHINEEMDIPIGFTDLSNLDTTEQDTYLKQNLNQLARDPFDLKRMPLIRCHLLRLSPVRHVVFVNVHHILADRKSMEILHREMSLIYAAIASGAPEQLPILPIQFTDYALLERKVSMAVQDVQFDYWKTKLVNIPGHLELPFSKQRPSIQSFMGEVEPITIDGPLASSLRKLAQQQNASLYMLLLAAFSVLLHRYTGKDDFCIGSPISGRNRAEIEPLIGLFINTLVMRCQPHSSQSFREVLQQTRHTAVEAYEHSEVPLQRLVAELHPEREPGSSPFFQIMFALDSFPREAPKGPSQIDTNPAIAKFDLTLQLHESGGEVAGHFEFRTDLFDRADIRRFGESFRIMLEAVVRYPDMPIARLDLLSPSERQTILVDWNATDLELSKQTLVHELFETQAVESPNAIAAIYGTETITYTELNLRANRVAHHLIALGACPGVCVGICMPRTISMLVVMLAALKSGAAYVPLDPAYPSGRLAFMVEDSQLAILATETGQTFSTPLNTVRVVSISAAADTIAQMPDRNPNVRMMSSDLAYVIYTSGSTGRPKGVAIEHHSAVSFLRWAEQVFSATLLRHVLASTSICFDLSIFEIFLPLATGSTVVLADNALELPRLPAAAKITLVNTVPSTMAALIKADALPSNVACVNLAGEPLSVSLVREIEERLPRAQIFDLYGPTETTTYSTFTRRFADVPATIGRPIANTHIYLLDAHLQPVPIGVPGQICIGGEGVARGYLHRPELTAQRFVRIDSLQSGERVYLTGDLGRYLVDGNIVYMGRIDQQVKIRGFRIELGEIESTLRRHQKVEDAVVVLQSDPLLGPSLAACVQAKAMQKIEIEELVALQRSFLPSYMVATQIYFLPSFPLTPNGKVDRKALSASLEQSVSLPVAAQVGPRDALEQELVSIWEKCFERSPIGIDEDFFAIGGHSLLALRVFSEIEKRLGKTLMLSLLLHAPTIRQLASLMRNEL